MSDEIVLRGVDSELVLEAVINEHGWTRCHFAKGEERIYLGAETIGYIVTRLSQGLTEPPSHNECQLAGEPVHWVLSLSERHHVLYTTFGETEQTLFWQDAHGPDVKIAGVIIIGFEQRKEWLLQLSRLTDQWRHTTQWTFRS